MVYKISCDSPRHGADACLQKHMGRNLSRCLGLLRRLRRHGKIPVHNPAWDLLISVPGSILDQEPPVLLTHLLRVFYRIIVIPVCDCHLRRTSLPYSLLTGLYGAFRHIDVSMCPKEPGSPGNALSVVSIRRRHKRVLRSLFPHIRFLKFRKIHLSWIKPQLPAQDPKHRIRSAQSLKRLHPEPLRLVLHKDSFYTKLAAKPPQLHHRCPVIRRNTLMKSPRLLRLSLRKRRKIHLIHFRYIHQNFCSVFLF